MRFEMYQLLNVLELKCSAKKKCLTRKVCVQIRLVCPGFIRFVLDHCTDSQKKTHEKSISRTFFSLLLCPSPRRSGTLQGRLPLAVTPGSVMAQCELIPLQMNTYILSLTGGNFIWPPAKNERKHINIINTLKHAQTHTDICPRAYTYTYTHTHTHTRLL